MFMVVRVIFKEKFKLHDSVMKTIFWPEKLIYLKKFGMNILYYVLCAHIPNNNIP